MEKVYFTGGIQTTNDPVWGVLRLLQEKENEMVDWMNEHERQHAEKSPEKSENPKVLSYKLSHDGVGLIAFLGNGISYHIHSYDLTPDQVQIRNQLIDMAGMKG